jgi:hypothetical protein
MGIVREAWTDERLDDLSHRVDDGFRGVRAAIGSARDELRAEVKAEVGSVRAEVHGLRSETNSNLALIHTRLDDIQRVMIYGVVSLSTATLAGMLAILTQL